MKNIWCCKSFTPGRLLRDQLVLKCSHEGAAALIILKQWHPYSEEQKSHFFEASSSMVVVARFCLWPCLFPLLVNDGAKVRRQLSAYHIFPINSQPPLPTSKNGNFSLHKSNEVRKLRSVGASSPKLGAAASRCQWTPHKDTETAHLSAKHQKICRFYYARYSRKRRLVFCWRGRRFLTMLLSVWIW